MFRYEVYKLRPFGEELDYGNDETLFHEEFTSLPSPPPSFTLSEPGMITLTFYHCGLLFFFLTVNRWLNCVEIMDISSLWSSYESGPSFK